MNAPLPKVAQDALKNTTIDDKYSLERGRVYMSGTQALVRLPMLQKDRDRRVGLDTGGFISGYRGSPLGNLDLSLWKAKKYLAEHEISFQPGVNEELGATAVWGSQQVNLFPGATKQGVFAMWYGKGPGLDRSMDVFKHANSAGSSQFGGVLLLAGDDHAAKSSTVAYQSEHNLQSAGIPVLYPSNVQEYLDFGVHGWAMSRYSGLWVAMKCVTDVLESSSSVELDPDRVQTITPSDFEMPEGGLSIRWPDPPLDQEARLNNYKFYAALAYVRANKLDKIIFDSPRARFGIMTAGKAYLDVRQALTDLGLDEQTCADIGIRLYKVGCVWPLEAQGARHFAQGLDEILVVEEKRQIMEYALKEELYNWRDDVRPDVYGKFDARDDGGGEWSVPRGKWLLPANYELSPAIIAKAIAKRLEKHALPDDVRARIQARIAIIQAKEQDAKRPVVVQDRKPWFCSGCPHNTSTRVPEGSRAVAGIGCHYMTIWMDRSTDTFTQMGGEGVPWIGQKDFTSTKHIFANLGDGTYFHSGILAIRASIAAKVNITYKILYNDAVAMTGGQPVDGTLTVPQINAQLHAEGATRIVIVSDEPEKYKGVSLIGNPDVFHRDSLDDVQLQLRDTEGTTILIYDQTCATEKRRRRKRNAYPDPDRRVFINEAVCEGCGDCGVKSNCLSVEPVDTPMGSKRRINQSSCNKDYSCLNGFCPSFVTAEGAKVRKPQTATLSFEKIEADIPVPAQPVIERSYNILVPGVGGTGVVTIGALLGMAAHLEQKGVNVLDITGLAQKGGAVVSHVQIGYQPADLHSTRIGMGEADLIIGCDAIVAASREITSKTRKGITVAAINSAKVPTAEIFQDPKWQFPSVATEQDMQDLLGRDKCDFLDANGYAVALLGDAIFANPLMLGYAWQKGWIPLHHESLERAIELNGVAIEKNLAAFEWGRYLAHHGLQSIPLGNSKRTARHENLISMPESIDTLIKRLEQHLTNYQNSRYAQRFTQAVARIRETEKAGGFGGHTLTEAVARNLAKLMSYKDEYEVARLYTEPAYFDQLRAQFEGEPGRDYALHVHLAPPAFSKKDKKGHLIKKKYGPWMMQAFRLLARFKSLRATALDPFGRTEERRAERALIDEYFALLDEINQSLSDTNYDAAVALARLPDDIRGYGHVKEANMQKAAARRVQLLEAYRRTALSKAA
ncbi:indolepyruvate ferredoxin oxidoreductase family protein [Advenella mimigardefordensis]|uniref:Putative indolepyruvate oxidoreductase subunit IorA n=1 Tax=Advenella mimigardefordensis (strain DSM 17166 / LMG 22922 / DPN7) TaxID=1247726 RepID=W0PE67_ADVMD|nr:indolepyruvate ferredoxin oxidoreductase family protein [Advenella mimigardefordensis]AHG63318.1 putative indolepyruvate oxidoreductase subunit IorA [Advenella mimigardefordensis DPN7]